MKNPLTYQSAIDATHPEEQPDGSPEEALSFAADALAMKLVGERHGKRDLVDLVRWLIMRKPDGLVEPDAKRPLPAGAIISYDGVMATVVFDDGGEEIKVKVDEVDHIQSWFWTLDGITCKVISLPGAVGD